MSVLFQARLGAAAGVLVAINTLRVIADKTEIAGLLRGTQFPAPGPFEIN